MTRSRWGATVWWALGILAVTSVPGGRIPRTPRVPGMDKVIHVGMYAGLGWHAARAAGVGFPLVAGILGFAALDEWHQGFVPGRSGDVGDWVADLVGGALGIVALRARERRESRA